MSDHVGCAAVRPDCAERFRHIENANSEQDASLQALRDALDTVPERTAARVMDSLGPRMERNEQDIQTVFGLIKAHSEQITALSAAVAALQGRAGGATGTLRVGVPVVIALVTAAASVGATLAVMQP